MRETFKKNVSNSKKKGGGDKWGNKGREEDFSISGAKNALG